MITLDRESHTYLEDGKPIDAPSISEVIKPYGRNYEGLDPFYADRGTAVHLGCSLLNEENLDWDSVIPEVEPYLRSYEKFLAKGEYVPFKWETPLYSESWGFCGTFDLVCSSKARLNLFDIKTAKSVDPVVELQLSGQEILWKEHEDNEIYYLGSLQLMSDGSEPKIKFYEKSNVFLAALSLWKWKQKHTRKRSQLTDSGKKTEVL